VEIGPTIDAPQCFMAPSNLHIVGVVLSPDEQLNLYKVAMENALILIVEDEPNIAEILDAYFQREGFRTVRAGDGETAILHHRMLSPDLVVLDVNLPKKNGHEVLQIIRQSADTPVLMATAMGEDVEKLGALRFGADDYVVKPFNPLEVVARAQAILRRVAAGESRSKIVRAGALEVNLETHSIRVLGPDDQSSRPDLTLTEFRLIAHMARVPHKVFSRAELLDACLPADGDALERTVDSHISKARRKLEQAGAVGCLEGVRGIGYRLIAL